MVRQTQYNDDGSSQRHNRRLVYKLVLSVENNVEEGDRKGQAYVGHTYGYYRSCHLPHLKYIIGAHVMYFKRTSFLLEINNQQIRKFSLGYHYVDNINITSI